MLDFLAGFDSPLRSVAWAAMSDGARAATVIGCVVIPAIVLCMLAAGGRKERRLGLALVGVLALLWGSYARLAGTLWYVDSAAGSNGDGTFGTPWNSPPNILAASIAPSDTICIRGTYTGAGWTAPEAGTSGNVTTYDFGNSTASAAACAAWGTGGIVATSGTAAALMNKGFNALVGGTFFYASGPAIQVNASDVLIRGVEIPGGDQGIVLTGSSTRDRVEIAEVYVHDVQGNGTSDASAAGVYMLQTAITTFHWTDLTIRDSRFKNNLQGAINLRCDVGASDCRFTRLSILRNVAEENDNTAFVVQDCYDGVDTAGTCGDPQSYTTADFTDVQLIDNECYRQTAGGCMAVYGVTSSTSAQGKSFIRGTIANFNAGVIGGVDLFNSRWVTVEGTECEGNTTTTIDANCVLIDYGNKNIVVRYNFAKNNAGIAGTPNSGAAVMLLKCEDVDVYGNLGIGNAVGLFVSGASFAESNCNVYANMWLGNLFAGWYIDNSQQASSVTVRNSVLSGPVCIEAESGGAAQTENYNDLYCPTRANYNGVGWSDGANSITSDPKLLGGTNPTTADGFRPCAGSPLCGAGTPAALGVNDFAGQQFGVIPNIGAFRCPSARRFLQ